MKSTERKIKSFIHGTIPYYVARVFTPQSANLPYYKTMKDFGYSRFVFDFRKEYDDLTVTIREDDGNGMKYVLHKGRKLYFQRDYSPVKIDKLYRSLLMEQDSRSAHHYLDNPDDVSGKTFLDIGSAEGLTSLEVIDKVNHIYLFERDEKWIEALEATFAPWKDKVTIIRKYISDRNDDVHQTLDDFFSNKPATNLFFKMDIEGAERFALKGAESLFENATNLSFAICTYHLPDDEKIVIDFLNRFDCEYINQKGFYKRKLRSILIKGVKK